MCDANTAAQCYNCWANKKAKLILLAKNVTLYLQLWQMKQIISQR